MKVIKRTFSSKMIHDLMQHIHTAIRAQYGSPKDDEFNSKYLALSKDISDGLSEFSDEMFDIMIGIVEQEKTKKKLSGRKGVYLTAMQDMIDDFHDNKKRITQGREFYADDPECKECNGDLMAGGYCPHCGDEG